jgi:hypothetical protein
MRNVGSVEFMMVVFVIAIITAGDSLPAVGIIPAFISVCLSVCFQLDCHVLLDVASEETNRFKFTTLLFRNTKY